MFVIERKIENQICLSWNFLQVDFLIFSIVGMKWKILF